MIVSLLPSYMEKSCDQWCADLEALKYNCSTQDKFDMVHHVCAQPTLRVVLIGKQGV